MGTTSIIGLVNNAALLLALGLLYDMLAFKPRGENTLGQQILTGLVLGAIGMAIMLNPWDFGRGVVFDTRSVLLCISGLFFGLLPTLLAMVMTGVLRLLLGGAGVWTGVAVIASSGAIGLLWRRLRYNKAMLPSVAELYLLGISVHVVMLAWMLSLPWEIAKGVLAKISMPVILIYPLATVALGKLLVSREKRRQSTEAIRNSEEKFRKLFDNHSAVKLLIDPDTGTIVEANNAAAKFYGWSVTELRQMRIQEINTLSPDQIAIEMEKARSLKKVHFEFPHRLADGTVRDVEIYSSSVEVEGRKLLHSIVHDITDRRRAEKALKDREQFLRTILKTTADGFWVLDTQGRVSEVNDSYCIMSGYSQEELIGKNIGELDADETHEQTAARIQRIISQGSEIFETLHRRKDGSVYSIEVSATYLDVDDGRFVCFGRDVTQRKKAEEKISHTNDLMRYIIEHANSAVALHDKNLRYIYVSQNYLKQYNVKEEDVIGRHHYDVFPDLPQKWRDIHQKALAGEISSAERDDYPRDDGTIEWTRWECRPWYEVNGSIGGFIVYTEVITDRVRAEEALRASEEAQRAMIEASPLAIVSIDPDGTVRTWNKAAERIFGWKDKDVIGKALPFVPREQIDDFANLRKRVLAGESFSQLELTRFHKDGSPVEISLSAAPIRDNKGEAIAIMALLEDITEQKRAEREKEKLQDQLIQAQRMESVGRLAGGVAHDYNNMLSVIIGYTDLALEKIDNNHPIRSNLEEIYAAANRSIDITRQLLAFSRKQTIAPKVLDLNDIIEGMLKMLRRLIGEDIDLAWYPGSQIWPVLMDPSQFDQILMNLCVNARDAIEDVGKITIETGTKSFDEEYCVEHVGFRPGDFVMIAVSDDGCGMDHEIQTHLFEPFFTTKEMGKGTGLGLATVYGIIKQNNGFINIYSEPGRGSTFRIYFPRYDSAPTQTERRPISRPDARGEETILLVEDELTILRMTKMMLDRLGYDVITANKPDEAIRIARAHEGKIHLLITDVVMPDMNGRDLTSRLHEIFPDLKVLFMSGYTANVIVHHGVLDEGIHFIQKPFSKKDLSEKVRETIGGNDK